MKVALYARVSTEEQNLEMQINALLDYAKKNNFEFELITEKESTRGTRPEKYKLYQRLLNKEFSGVVVWKLDRWGRSVQELAREVTTLYNRGVNFISLRDNINLGTPEGKLQFYIISAFAEFERDIISARTKEGLKKAKNVGKRGKDKKPRRKSGYYLRYMQKKGPLENEGTSLLHNTNLL